MLAGIKAKIGYKRRPGKYGGKPSVVVDNTLNRQFDVAAPNQFLGHRHYLHQNPFSGM
jgi:putative transposase